MSTRPATRFPIATRFGSALGIWFEEGGDSRLAVGRHTLEDLVAIVECRGHQVGGFVRRIAKHDALVARAFVLVRAFVDALRDMRRLAVEVVLEPELVPVETGLFIADFLDGFAPTRLDPRERARRPYPPLQPPLPPAFAPP